MFGQIGVALAIGAVVIMPSSPAVAATSHVPRASAAAAGGVDHDGPFGIVMGEPLADLGATTKIGPGQYQILAPPRPNGSFGYVTVYAFSDGGVCRIVAVGAPVQFDTTGAKVRSTVDNLATTLAQKYGQYKKTDYCNGDEVICGEVWVTQLYKNQAQYHYSWDLSKSARPDGVGSVELDVKAISSDTSGPMIFYNSKDAAACDAKINAAEGSSL